MKKNLYTFMSLFVALSFLLGACAGSATPTAEPAEPTTADVSPTEEPPEPTQIQEETTDPETDQVDLDAAFGDLLSAMQAYNTIKADGLLTEMVEDTPPFLLDVRTAAELEEQGHIEGAVHVPLRELAQHIELYPDFDTPIVIYCGSGWRATIAMVALDAMGWNNVRALKTKFADWVEAGNPVVEGLPEEAMVLDVAQPDAAMVAEMDAVLSSVPEGYGVIKADDLNLALGENPYPVVIDVRRLEEVEEKGIIDTGDVEQIHIPLEEFVAEMGSWPQEDASIVVYCGSGHRSTMAMTMLWSYGYSDVRSLKGGFGGWVEAGYSKVGGAANLDAAFGDLLSAMEAYNTIKADGLLTEMVEDTPPFLLDVRTAAELEEQGHIEGAVHVPLRELAQHIELYPDFDTPIVTYCGSGWRATIAMVALDAMGWNNVRALKTKFADWVEAGNPVVEGPPEEAMVLDVAQPDAAMVEEMDAVLSSVPEGYGVITADDLNLALGENSYPVVIDVRRLEEVEEKGIIDTGDVEQIHIPLEEFVAEMGSWPQEDASIVVYCGSGHRSTMAMTMLWSYGYSDVHSLKGGFGGWVEAGYSTAEVAVP